MPRGDRKTRCRDRLVLEQQNEHLPASERGGFLGISHLLDQNGRGNPEGAPQKQEQYEAQIEENARTCGAGQNHNGDRRTILQKLAGTRRKGKLLSLDPANGSLLQQAFQFKGGGKMSKALSSLAVGTKIEVPVLPAYQSRFGAKIVFKIADKNHSCLLYTSPSPRD